MAALGSVGTYHQAIQAHSIALTITNIPTVLLSDIIAQYATSGGYVYVG